MEEATGLSGLRVSYSAPGEPWQVSVPDERVADLLSEHSARRRAFLVRLLNGYSRGAAAAAVGVSARATQLWAKKDRGFATAADECEAMGFAAVLESELYRRAMAGPKDSGSMRALELVMRSRSPEYRTKVTVGRGGGLG